MRRERKECPTGKLHSENSNKKSDPRTTRKFRRSTQKGPPALGCHIFKCRYRILWCPRKKQPTSKTIASSIHWKATTEKNEASVASVKLCGAGQKKSTVHTNTPKITSKRSVYWKGRPTASSTTGQNSVQAVGNVQNSDVPTVKAPATSGVAVEISRDPFLPSKECPFPPQPQAATHSP